MSTPNTRYKIEVFDSSGNLVADLSGRALSRRINKSRNRADNMQIQFDYDSLRDIAVATGLNIIDDIFAVNRNELRLTRDTTVISTGQISNVKVTGGETRTINVNVDGWFDLLNDRYTGKGTDRIFSATDAGQIAWTLINESQAQTNGNLGITSGTIQTSVNRDRTYSYKNINQAIIELSEVINGFDFEITWDKKFNVYYPKIGSRRTDIAFTYPGNIKELDFERDGTKVTNYVMARGSGTGSAALVSIIEDTTSESVYGLRESIIDHPDVVIQTTLTEYANAEVSVNKQYNDIPYLILDGNRDPQLGSYNIGDEILIITDEKELFRSVNDYFRIDAMDIEIDENDAESVKVTLGK